MQESKYNAPQVPHKALSKNNIDFKTKLFSISSSTKNNILHIQAIPFYIKPLNMKL